ncbi:unnamed protein product [Boreogadus saida]
MAFPHWASLLPPLDLYVRQDVSQCGTELGGMCAGVSAPVCTDSEAMQVLLALLWASRGVGVAQVNRPGGGAWPRLILLDLRVICTQTRCLHHLGCSTVNILINTMQTPSVSSSLLISATSSLASISSCRLSLCFPSAASKSSSSKFSGISSMAGSHLDKGSQAPKNSPQNHAGAGPLVPVASVSLGAPAQQQQHPPPAAALGPAPASAAPPGPSSKWLPAMEEIPENFEEDDFEAALGKHSDSRHELMDASELVAEINKLLQDVRQS